MTTARARSLRKTPPRVAPARRDFDKAMIALVCMGLMVAGYMTYSDLNSASLVCGGLGDCDTAHASVYARLLGVPVSLLGLAGYAVVAALLGWRSRSQGDPAYLVRLAVLAVVLAGAVFSVYLTYIEFFVIHAVCPWCVVSAVVMVTLALFAALAVRRDLADGRD